MFLITKTNFYTTSALVFGILGFQVYNMIIYVRKTNKYITDFLESIQYSEFSRSFQIDGLGTAFDPLKEIFNKVIAEFQKIRNEKEEQYYFLQNVIQHIGISMIAYQKNGKIEMFNNASKRIFRKGKLTYVQDLGDVSEELVNKLLTLKTGEKTLVKIKDNNDILQLVIFAKEFKIREQMLTLVSIQNIQNELEEKEMEAWQNLIRVLTHEIMNSIAPIVSLTSTTSQLLNETKESISLLGNDEAEENIEDIRNALKIINKRSSGLLHFVETYRNLTRIPKPNFKIFYIRHFISNIFKLLEKDLNSKSIQWEESIEPPELELVADEELIEQVFINLIKNSIYALDNADEPKISIKAFVSELGKVIIEVSDNGQGIIQEVLDKIFIPFFTTKQNGSGIGLSLSRQIIRLHGGTISAYSEPNIKTSFILKF